MSKETTSRLTRVEHPPGGERFRGNQNGSAQCNIMQSHNISRVVSAYTLTTGAEIPLTVYSPCERHRRSGLARDRGGVTAGGILV